MSETTATKSLWGAVLEAQRNIGAVTKDKTAKVKTKSGHEYEYKFASTEDVMAAARGALLSQGVLAQRVSYEIRTGGAGAEVWSVFRLVHPESGEVEVFDAVPMPISGVGAGDKALAGALTYGWAYWLRDLLAIPREDEHAPDRRKSDDGAPRWDHSRRESSRKVTPAEPSARKPPRDKAWQTGQALFGKVASRRESLIAQNREALAKQGVKVLSTPQMVAKALGVEGDPPHKYDIPADQWDVIVRAFGDDIDDLEMTLAEEGPEEARR